MLRNKKGGRESSLTRLPTIMPIAYSVQCGVTQYCYTNSGARISGDEINGQEISALSQISFLETGVINFPIGKVSAFSNADVSTAYNNLSSYIGNGVDMLYAAQRLQSGETTGYISATGAFPSLTKQFQVTSQSLKDVNIARELNVAYYFPALKKVIIVGNGGVMYNVEENGSLTNRLTCGRFSFGVVSGDYDNIYSIWYFNPDVEFNSETAIVPGNWGAFDINAYQNRIGVSLNTQWRQQITKLFSNFSNPDWQEPVLPDDPFSPGGNSDVGTLPPGTFDNTSDPIPDSPLPTISAANTGFTRIYNPTLSQVQELANYLWTDETVIETIWNHIKQFFADPMQAIIGFNLVPCQVPDAGNEEFKIMYISTGVSMNVAANQFVDVDCGTYTLERPTASALDQNPYTKISCFLPFIGMVTLNTDEVMGTTLHVKYRIDIVSGSCVAKILVDENCLYQYSGHCAITIPFSSGDFSSYVSAAISVAKLAVVAATSGGAGAGAVAVAEASQATGDVAEAAEEAADAAGDYTPPNAPKERKAPKGTKGKFKGVSPRNIANTVGATVASKMVVEHSGSFSGNSGYLGIRYPYLIIERPRQCLPASYGHLNGYPAMITMSLGVCSGYTRIQQCELSGMSATNPEQSEILELLKQGVYF